MREGVEDGEYALSNHEWAIALLKRDHQIMDEVYFVKYYGKCPIGHFSMKQDLIEHIWNLHGLIDW